MLLLAVCAVACGDPVERSLKRAVRNDPEDPVSGVKIVRTAVSKSFYAKDFLDCWRSDLVSEYRRTSNATLTLFMTVDRDAVERAEYLKGFVGRVKEFSRTRAEELNVRVAVLYAVFYTYREKGQRLETKRYVLLDNDGRAVAGPFRVYEDGYDAYFKYTREHVPGFAELYDSYVPEK